MNGMADCAIFILYDFETDRALMEDRPDLKPGSDHYWVFPGGKVEDREMADMAMLRECREELGVTVGEYHWMNPEHTYPAPGTKQYKKAHEGWRTIPFLVPLHEVYGMIPERTLDGNHAPLEWRDPLMHADTQGDGYTCVNQVARQVVLLAQEWK